MKTRRGHPHLFHVKQCRILIWGVDHMGRSNTLRCTCGGSVSSSSAYLSEFADAWWQHIVTSFRLAHKPGLANVLSLTKGFR